MENISKLIDAFVDFLKSIFKALKSFLASKNVSGVSSWLDD